MYPLPFTMKVRPEMTPDPNDDQIPQEISTTGAIETDESTTRAVTQRNVPSKPSPPALQPEQLEDTKPEPNAWEPREMSTQAAAVDVLSNSFAPPPQGFAAGNYRPAFPTNPQFSMPPDASLMSQPLITTPGCMQLSALLGNERRSEYRHGFTPRPQGLHPAQSSVITNRTYHSDTPFPFPPPSLLRSTSTSSTYSFGNSSFGRDVMSGFNFSGFTPMMQAPTPSVAQQQQMPTPSPLYALSSQQVAALGCTTSRHNNARPATTPVPAFGPTKKSSEAGVAKANNKSKKKTKPTQRSQQVDVSTVMTMNLSTQPCKCPKNQCIKLYCECFHRGQICDPSECNCVKCLNTAAESTPTGVRTKRVKETLSRKGLDAFKVKPKKTGVGCSCKKSR